MYNTDLQLDLIAMSDYSAKYFRRCSYGGTETDTEATTRTTNLMNK